jgi:hypothetical protein
VLTDKPKKDYASIINSAFLITAKNLFNKALLKSIDWVSFRKKVNDLKLKIADDYELAAIFFWLGKDLAFTPFEIRKTIHRNNNSDKNIEVNIRELKSNIAVYEVDNLSLNQKEMDSIAVIIAKKGCTNLVTDLRGRTNINPCTANVLVNYLSDKSFKAGIYLTRKWFESSFSIPNVQGYKKIV